MRRSLQREHVALSLHTHRLGTTRVMWRSLQREHVALSWHRHILDKARGGTVTIYPDDFCHPPPPPPHFSLPPPPPWINWDSWIKNCVISIDSCTDSYNSRGGTKIKLCTCVDVSSVPFSSLENSYCEHTQTHTHKKLYALRSQSPHSHVYSPPLMCFRNTEYNCLEPVSTDCSKVLMSLAHTKISYFSQHNYVL